jgi:integration host factor subunit beta
MTKSQLITLLSEKSPAFMEDDVAIAVQAILDSISRALEDGNRVEIRGFGSFGLNYRPSRKGRNPKSGEPVVVPPKFAPHFKPGKEMKSRVDSPRTI